MPMPGAGEIAQQAVDFRLGADVDAARRLVHDDDLGLDRQLLGDRHLLLVAARERRHRHRRCRPCARRAAWRDRVAWSASALASIKPKRPGQRCQIERRDILRDRQVEEDAGALAVFREIDDAGLAPRRA